MKRYSKNAFVRAVKSYDLKGLMEYISSITYYRYNNISIIITLRQARKLFTKPFLQWTADEGEPYGDSSVLWACPSIAGVEITINRDGENEN